MKIGLIGWYGHQNVGDERILYCLRRFFNGHNIFVTTGFDDAARKIEFLNSCDYVLLGGGGLILRGLNTHTNLIEQIRPPFGCIGISVEACHNDNATFINALKEKAEFILVRDIESRELLDNHFKVIVSSDLTFLYPFDVINPVESDICGVNLRPWYFWKCEHGDEYYKYMMQLSRLNPNLEKEYPHPKWNPNLALNIIKNRFSKLLPVPLYFEKEQIGDNNLLRYFFDDVKDSISPPDTYKLFRYLIGMRLHSLIFACQMGIPFISLSYQPKNERFCKALELGDLSVDLFDISQLDNAISKMKNSFLELRDRLLCFREKAFCDINYTMNKILNLVTHQAVGSGTDLIERHNNYGVPVLSSARQLKVSVVLPTYNHLQFLPHAVKSLLAQTYSDFELIIVNDGSTDGTREYLDTLQDPRIRIVHQENKRLPSALNTGFNSARGELLTWISSDNYCSPIFLEAFVRAFEAYPEAGFAYSSFAWIDEKGNIIRIERDQNVNYRTLLTKNYGLASFMYRRVCQDTVGLYDTDLEGAEDWDMWIRIAEQFKVVYVPEILYYYRHHSQSMTSKKLELIHETSVETIKKALQRKKGQFSIPDLYPAIKMCQDQQTAQYGALFDFGTSILGSSFIDAEIACHWLENALQIASDSYQIMNNLAVAYAKAGKRDKATELVRILHAINDPVVQSVCDLINKGLYENNPGLLRGALLFTPDKSSSELFQIEKKQEDISAFTIAMQQTNISSSTSLEKSKVSHNSLVSVIIPAFNCKKWVCDAIDSVMNQTYPFHEIIVVDDGSADDTGTYLKERYGDAIRYFYQENRGLAAARNKGLDESRGRYIQFLDCDDIIRPDKFEFQINAIRDIDGLALSICDYLSCDIDDMTKERIDRYLSPIMIHKDPIVDLISRWETEFSIPAHCFLFSSAFFTTYKIRFDETLPNHEDWDCWMEIFILKPVIEYVDQKYAIYRIRSQAMCYDFVKMKYGYLKAIQKQIHLLKEDIELVDLLSKKRAQIEYTYRNVILEESPYTSYTMFENEQDRLIAKWDKLLGDRDRQVFALNAKLTAQTIEIDKASTVQHDHSMTSERTILNNSIPETPKEGNISVVVPNTVSTKETQVKTDAQSENLSNTTSNDINAQKLLAVSYYGTGRFADAFQIYLNLHEIYPEDVEILLELAHLSTMMNNFAKADKFYKKIAQLENIGEVNEATIPFNQHSREELKSLKNNEDTISLQNENTEVMNQKKPL